MLGLFLLVKKEIFLEPSSGQEITKINFFQCDLWWFPKLTYNDGEEEPCQDRIQKTELSPWGKYSVTKCGFLPCLDSIYPFLSPATNTGFSLLKLGEPFKLRTWRSVWLGNSTQSAASLLSLRVVLSDCVWYSEFEPEWILVCFRPVSTSFLRIVFPCALVLVLYLVRCKGKCPRSVMSSMVFKSELVF